MQTFRLSLAVSLVVVLIIGSSSSFLNVGLSKSSWFPLLNNMGISINDSTGSSNFNSAHNQSLSTSHAYFAHPPSYTLGDNISGAVNSNNKVVMIGFDDGWKSQITYAKPILDKYGFKASFFIVC
jgi:polysaccharide deacetylase